MLRDERRLRALIDEGVDWLHLAPPCKPWSIARARIGLSADAPDPSRRLEDMAKALPLIALTARLAGRVADRGGVFTIEHPKRSLAWKSWPLRELARRPGVRKVQLDMCRFGLRVDGELRLKPTILLTNAELPHMERKCNHGTRHAHLTGPDCARAAAYTEPFCRWLARDALRAVPATLRC